MRGYSWGCYGRIYHQHWVLGHGLRDKQALSHLHQRGFPCILKPDFLSRTQWQTASQITNRSIDDKVYFSDIYIPQPRSSNNPLQHPAPPFLQINSLETHDWVSSHRIQKEPTRPTQNSRFPPPSSIRPKIPHQQQAPTPPSPAHSSPQTTTSSYCHTPPTQTP